MFKKKKFDGALLPEDNVSLKPLFGIKPGIYLSIIYALVLLLLLAALFLLPGIRNYGSKVDFYSQPWGAAIRIDDVYQGTTPCTLFVPAGNRQIEFVLPGFEPQLIEKNIQGRLFASLFFPRKETITVNLNGSDPLDIFRLGARSFTEWSLTGEATAVYQHPRTLSEAVYRAGFLDPDAETLKNMQDGLAAAARFATSKSAVRELLRAQFLLQNAGIAASPLALVQGMEHILDNLSANQGSAFWLAGLLSNEEAAILANSTWYKNQVYRAEQLASNQAVKTAQSVKTASGNSMRVGSILFTRMEAAVFTQLASFPRKTALEQYWIAEDLVSNEAYSLFTSANPEWAATKRLELIDAGLVGTDYLRSPEFHSYPDGAAAGISWYAADAYCSWLTSFLPDSMATYEVRLPTEAEWEYFVRSTAKPASYYATGLWEWCREPFVPLDFIHADKKATSWIDSPERPLRGGSWINPAGSIGLETRASLPPSTSSFFTGFRPVIALKETVD